jgi:hypothetical protein
MAGRPSKERAGYEMGMTCLTCFDNKIQWLAGCCYINSNLLLAIGLILLAVASGRLFSKMQPPYLHYYMRGIIHILSFKQLVTKTWELKDQTISSGEWYHWMAL